MKKRTIAWLCGLLLLAGLLSGCASARPAAESTPAAAQETESAPAETIPVPTAEACAEGFFRVVGRFHPGTAGASLGRALSACEAYRFAAENRLAEADGALLHAVLCEARESLSEEERSWFDENFESVCGLIDACRNNWEENRPLFEDAGAAEEMEKLLGDPEAQASWAALCAETEQR